MSTGLLDHVVDLTDFCEGKRTEVTTVYSDYPHYMSPISYNQNNKHRQGEVRYYKYLLQDHFTKIIHQPEKEKHWQYCILFFSITQLVD